MTENCQEAEYLKSVFHSVSFGFDEIEKLARSFFPLSSEHFRNLGYALHRLAVCPRLAIDYCIKLEKELHEIDRNYYNTQELQELHAGLNSFIEHCTAEYSPASNPFAEDITYTVKMVLRRVETVFREMPKKDPVDVS